MTRSLPHVKYFKLYKDEFGDFCILYKKQSTDDYATLCYVENSKVENKWEQFAAELEELLNWKYTKTKLNEIQMRQLVEFMFSSDWETLV